MTHYWKNVQRARDLGSLSPKLDVFITSLPSKLLLGREGWETVRARADGCLQGNNIFQTQHCQCTHEYNEIADSMPKTYIGSSQTESQHWEGEVHMKLHPLAKKLSEIGICWEREISFLKWTVTDYINGTPELASGLRVVGLHKVNSVCSVCLLFGCWFFFFLCLSVGLFWFFFLRERTCSWVGRKMGRASGSWEREKIMMKIYSMKKILKSTSTKNCVWKQIS